MTDILLLDGSMGQELVKRLGKPPTPLWSTAVMLERPDLVREVHDSYFAAGATIATTNSYALHRNRLERAGIADQLDGLVEISMDQAQASRDAHGYGLIAGSMGPYLASYRPDLNPDIDEAAQRYATLGAQLAQRCDLLLAETVCSLAEAEGILKGVADIKTPLWIAFSTADDDGTKLRSGEDLAALAPLLNRYDPDAVLINCTRPEEVAKGLDILAPMGRPIGAYANGFTRISDGFLQTAPTVDTLTARRDLTPDAYAEIALSWIDHGATILGGCCEVGPDHIAELARQLRAKGHRIT